MQSPEKIRVRKPETETEMMDGIAEEVISDTMQDIIMSDILMEIIANNEVSRMADQHVEQDIIANHFAEGIMKETVLRMLTSDVAQPMITIADSEK